MGFQKRNEKSQMDSKANLGVEDTILAIKDAARGAGLIGITGQQAFDLLFDASIGMRSEVDGVLAQPGTRTISRRGGNSVRC